MEEGEEERSVGGIGIRMMEKGDRIKCNVGHYTLYAIIEDVEEEDLVVELEKQKIILHTRNVIGEKEDG